MKLVQLKRAVINFKPFSNTLLLHLGDAAQPKPEPQSSRLSDYGLILAPAPRDGNCFFKSVALNLLSESRNWTDTLTRVGILPHMRSNLDALADEMRNLFCAGISRRTV